jgi:nitrilase
MTATEPFVVAVVQDASVFLDRDASIEKTIALAREAAGKGAKLVLFPEAFISGYPRGLSFGAVVGSRNVEGRKLFRRYAESAIALAGPDGARLGAAARELGIHLAVGVVERDPVSAGTLYCSLALWGPDSILQSLHRKLKPTASERLIWGEGDGSGLRTIPTEMGRVGGLICWENYMPLARTTLYEQGVDLYLAPTADGRESWQATIRHIALEGRCFVLACNQYVTKADYPDDLGNESMREIAALSDPLSRGGSAIIGPLGDYLAGPLWDEAGILYATIDLGAITEARFDFDVVGHYSRPDVFQLSGPIPPSLGGLGAMDEMGMLGDLLFGGPGLFPPIDDDFDDDGFGPEVDAPFFPTFPADFREKKPATRLPTKSSKRTRRGKG